MADSMLIQQNNAATFGTHSFARYDTEALKNYAAMSAMYWPGFDYSQLIGQQANFATQQFQQNVQQPQQTPQQQQHQLSQQTLFMQQQQQQLQQQQQQHQQQQQIHQQPELQQTVLTQQQTAYTLNDDQIPKIDVGEDSNDATDYRTTVIDDVASTSQPHTPHTLDNTATTATTTSGESDQSVEIKLNQSCTSSNNSANQSSLNRTTPSPSLTANNHSPNMPLMASLPYEMRNAGQPFTSTPNVANSQTQPGVAHQFATNQNQTSAPTPTTTNGFPFGMGAFNELADAADMERSMSGQSRGKKRAHPVPSGMKDEAYWERRRRNNESARRSRESRRQKEDQIAVRVVYLEQENLQLRTEVSMLRAECEKMRILMYNAGMSQQGHQLQ